MKPIIFIIFWVVGIIIALLGNKRIREYKDYENPRFVLWVGIFLCVVMSWVMVFLSYINEEFEFPKKKK